MPVTILNESAHLFFGKSLWDKCSNCSHFTGEETEVQNIKKCVLGFYPRLLGFKAHAVNSVYGITEPLWLTDFIQIESSVREGKESPWRFPWPPSSVCLHHLETKVRKGLQVDTAKMGERYRATLNCVPKDSPPSWRSGSLFQFLRYVYI